MLFIYALKARVKITSVRELIHLVCKGLNDNKIPKVK